MKLSYFLLITVLLFTTNFYSQNYSLTGIVTDSLAEPLPYTNILAKPSSEQVEMAFAICDEKGRYKLVFVANEEYTVSFSYIGFKSKEFKITLTENGIKNIQLQTSTNQLDEVIIINPITVKQDTIIYDTKAFMTGTERKLKQVLKKLPGVEVDKNGSVTVLGKKVNKLLVDGKTFFGGGTKLGIENIPADAVDGIEVIDNYNEVAFLKGISGSDKMAMNIKLKKDKKRFTFGDIEVGAGTDKHYLAHPTVFYYSPKTNINFIGDINDIGVKSFTIKDYLDFEGGIGKMLTDPSSYFKLSRNEFANFLGNQDYKNGKNKFGAINITQAINNKWDMSSYAIFSNTINETQNETINQYLSDNNNLIEDKIEKGNIDNSFFMAKLALDYIPNNTSDISYSAFYKSSTNENLNNISSLTQNILNNLKLNSDDKTITLKQNAEWHKKISRKHTSSLTINYQYDKSNPKNYWLTNQPILQGLIPLQNDLEFNINQIKNLQTHNLNVLFKHYWVINNSNHIYTTVGNNLLHDNYTTNEYQKLSNNTINNFNTAGFGNDLALNINDLYIGIQHKFKVGIFTVKSGISAHYYHWKVNQLTNIKNSKITWLPDFLTQIDFNKSEHLNFKYNLKSSFAGASKYANQFQLSRYNAVIRGNEKLENELYHSARLWYTKFSLYRGIIINGSIGYTKRIKTIRNQIQLQGIDRFSSPILTSNPENSWTLSTNIRKKLGKVTLKIKGNSQFSDYLQIVNNNTSKNESSTQKLGIELATNFKEWPNIEIGFDKGFSRFSTSNNNSKFTNENPFINFEYDFLKNFILKANYSSTEYKNYTGQKNRYEIANASLFYQKEDSAWGFRISGSNILGAQFKNENSFSEFIVSDQKTYILPRIWLFTLIYKL